MSATSFKVQRRIDVSTKGTSWSSALDEQQAQVYVGLLKACLAVPACKSFETWGFTDASTWKGSNHYPLPFDAQYKPKAAAQAMLDVLTGAPVPAPTPAAPGCWAFGDRCRRWWAQLHSSR